MNWIASNADYIFTTGSIIFILSLIPAVLAPEKPARSTCAMTSATLYVFALTQLAIELPFASITTAITATMWLMLLLQPRLTSS